MVKAHKISYYVLWVMFAAIIAVFALFFVGGDAQGEAVIASVDPDMWQPANTDALLYLNYGLFALAAIGTVVSFVHFFVCNPKASMGSIYVLVGSLVTLAITWCLGSAEKLEIISYEGTDNVGFWAQASDMFIFSLYALVIIAVLCMMVGGLKKKLS